MNKEIEKKVLKALNKVTGRNYTNINLEENLKSQLSLDSIQLVIPHQANIRIINATAKKLSMSTDHVVVTVHEHGNTSAASVPLALNEAVRDGRIKRGETILLEAFGGGFTWGSALVRY